MAYKKRVSVFGWCQDLRIVGTKARRSANVTKTADSAGCFATSQNPTAMSVIIKIAVSERVMFFLPSLKPKIKTVRENIPAANVTNAAGAARSLT